MATSTQQTTDVAGELARLLRTVENLRVYEMVLDQARPPCVVLGQPNVDFNDQSGGFCTAVWYFPVNFITARSDPATAQRDLSRMLLDVVAALSTEPSELFSTEALDARPITVAVGGTELPGYLLNTRIRA